MVKTAKLITVTLPHRDCPGSLARICDALRGASINIEAITCSAHPEAANEVYIVVDDTERAELALERIGKIHEDEVLAFERPNKQGVIFELARKCAGANINIRNIFATTHGPNSRGIIYLEVDDVEKAKEILAD